MTAQSLTVGVDIGGTKTEAVVVGADGAILHTVKLPTGHGPDAVVATAVAAVTSLAELAGVSVAEFASIGIGIPGGVDCSTGTVSHAMNLGIEKLELGGALFEQLGVRVQVENDVNAAAFGAFRSLGEGEATSIGYLNLGTGLAAGLVLRGELWRGSRGSAGEIGHVLIDPNGPLDLDGQRGGLEVVASGSGIARQWASGDDHAVPAVFAAADAGDEHAIEIRRRLFEGVAASVRILVLTVDVELVVIGGGLSKLGDRLLDGVGAVIAEWEAKSPFITSLELASRIRFVPEGVPVAAIGAAHLGCTDG
jgi:glucokinase